MKKTLLFTLLILLTSVAAMASEDYTFSGTYEANGAAVTDFTIYAYECLNADCTQNKPLGTFVDNGQEITGQEHYTVTDGDLIVRAPQPADYAFYWVTPGHRPKAFRARNAAGQAITDAFRKRPSCSAVVDSFVVEDEIHPGEPLVVHSQARLDAQTRSAFSINSAPTGLTFIPPALRDTYYSADTRVEVIVTNLDTNTQAFHDSADLAILADTTEDFTFTWTPQTTGNYRVELRSTVTDELCEQSNPHSTTQETTVLQERVNHACFADANNLRMITATEGLVINKQLKSTVDVFSKHAEEAGRFTPVDTLLTITITGSHGAIHQETRTITASNTAQTEQILWTAPAPGYYTVTTQVSPQGTLCDGLTQHDETLTLQVLMGNPVGEEPAQPRAHDITFTVKDSTTRGFLSKILIALTNGLNRLTGAGGEAQFKLVNGDYAYTIEAEGYNTKTGSFTVEDEHQGLLIVLERAVPQQVATINDLVISGVRLPHANSIKAGSMVPITLTFSAPADISNVRMTAFIHELGSFGATGPFTVPEGSSTKRVTLFIPEDVRPGHYYIRLNIGGKVVYRPLSIIN